jgi:hypothetical protein
MRRDMRQARGSSSCNGSVGWSRANATSHGPKIPAARPRHASSRARSANHLGAQTGVPRGAAGRRNYGFMWVQRECGAGEGNRTLVTCLGSKSSTIELHPHIETPPTASSVVTRWIGAGPSMLRALAQSAGAGQRIRRRNPRCPRHDGKRLHKGALHRSLQCYLKLLFCRRIFCRSNANGIQRMVCQYEQVPTVRTAEDQL